MRASFKIRSAKEICIERWRPRWWIFLRVVLGTGVIVQRAPAHDAWCTTAALQRAALPRRIGTPGKPVRWIGRQWFPGTFDDRFSGSRAILREYRFAEEPRLPPSPRGQRAQEEQTPLPPRLSRGPARRACGSTDTSTPRNRVPPTGLAHLPTGVFPRVRLDSCARHRQTSRLPRKTAAITSHYQ